MAMVLLINILYSYMMRHFNAKELLYAFIFHICDFDNDALYDMFVWIGHRSSICNYSVNFDPFNAEHMKYDNQNHKYGTLMHTLFISNKIRYNVGGLGQLLVILWPCLSIKANRVKKALLTHLLVSSKYGYVTKNWIEFISFEIYIYVVPLDDKRVLKISRM